MTQIELQNLISSYNTYYQQGQVSKEELVALLQGINVMEDLGNDVNALDEQEQLNMILNTAINAASLLSSV
jgi:hypothetical protein